MQDLVAIIQRIRSGETQAMEELVDRFQPMAVNYAWSLLGDWHLAQDAAQEAFIRTLPSQGLLRAPEAFPKWFKTVLRNICLGMKRGNRLLPVASLPLGELDTQEEALRRELWQAVGQLAEEDRSILGLFYLSGYSQSETAALLGISESRVNNRLHALRERLKQEMLEKMDGTTAGDTKAFTRKILTGVKKLEQFGADETMLTYFCGSLSVLLRAAGADPRLDYTHIVAASGAAFRMVWRGWFFENETYGTACDDEFALVRWTLEACGCSAVIKLNAGYGSKAPKLERGMTYADERTARQDIVASIQRGLPVMAIGVVAGSEFCVVTGYDEEGAVLYGWNYFQNELPQTEDFTIDAGGYFRKRNWYADTRGYVLIKELEPVTLDGAFYARALRRAVAMERTASAQGHPAGLAAFRAWADALLAETEDGTPSDAPDWQTRFIIYLNNHCVLNERGFAARFLRRAAEALPQQAEALLEAAGHLQRSCAFAGEMWKHVSFEPEGMAKFCDADTLAILAGHILRARMWEERATGAIERALARLDGID